MKGYLKTILSINVYDFEILCTCVHNPPIHLGTKMSIIYKTLWHYGMSPLPPSYGSFASHHHQPPFCQSPSPCHLCVMYVKVFFIVKFLTLEASHNTCVLWFEYVSWWPIGKVKGKEKNSWTVISKAHKITSQNEIKAHRKAS